MTLEDSNRKYIENWQSRIKRHGTSVVSCDSASVLVCHEVFDPSDDLTFSTAIVAQNMLPTKNLSVLDVGTGTGILAILAAQRGAKDVLATDTFNLAAECAKRNVQRNNLRDYVSVAQADILPVDNTMKFDLVLANLPILGEEDVWLTHDRLLRQVGPHLLTGGRIQITWASFGAPDILDELFRAHGFMYSRVEVRRLGVAWYLYTAAKPLGAANYERKAGEQPIEPPPDLVPQGRSSP